MQAMTLRLPDEVHEALRREAFESRRSMNAVVIEALYRMGGDFLREPHVSEANRKWRDGSKSWPDSSAIQEREALTCRIFGHVLVRADAERMYCKRCASFIDKEEAL